MKEAHKNQDLAGIDKYSSELNEVFHKASEEIYKNSQTQGPSDGHDQTQGSGNTSASGGSTKKDDEVTDVEFEEVK